MQVASTQTEAEAKKSEEEHDKEKAEEEIKRVKQRVFIVSEPAPTMTPAPILMIYSHHLNSQNLTVIYS